MTQLLASISTWYKGKDPFALLQAAYLVLATALLLVAALIGLMNTNAGQAIVFYAFIAALTFVGNGVLWALLKTFLLPTIEKRAKPSSSRKK